MKRLIVSMLAAWSMLSMLVVGVSAAPAANVGPYEGLFRGYAYGDRSSKAPLTLDLSHRGSDIEGNLMLGEGLYLDGGMCGSVQVPVIEQQIEGQTVRGNPNHLVASPSFDAGGFAVRVDLQSTISADGKTISARAKFDLPWFCGRDPVLTATIYRN